MNSTNTIILILAGGLGKRMNSSLPKVLHKVGDEPMLVKVIIQATMLNPIKILIVVGKFKNIIHNTISQYISAEIMDKIVFINQEPALGTGHAVQQAVPILREYPGTQTIVVSGDTPLITASTLHTLNDSPATCCILATEFTQPFGYGRICLDIFNMFVKIVEQKDCNLEQELIRLCNSGVYMFNTTLLCKHIDKLTNQNSQQEFYLTDLPEIVAREEMGAKIDIIILPTERQFELVGVNTIAQLASVNAQFITGQ